MAKKRQLFADLKEAIEALIKDATPDFQDGAYTNDMVVSKDLLYTLQSEYNIHFVEPSDKQLDVIKK